MRIELCYNRFILIADGKYNEDDQYVSLSSPLQNIENFLECLTNADKDGRIFIDNQGNFFVFLEQ